MIFKMQKEIDDLHKALDNIGSNQPLKGSKIVPHIEDAKLDEEPSHFSLVKLNNFKPFDPDANIEEKESENENSTMTLEDTERETIRMSLKRNGGKRKKTAEELNISERTLYRKIKEYGLDNI